LGDAEYGRTNTASAASVCAGSGVDLSSITLRDANDANPLLGALVK
jgi:hypothetical protein